MRLASDDFEERAQVGMGRGFEQGGDAAEDVAMGKGGLDARADLHLSGQLGGDEVIELFAQSQIEGDTSDHGEMLKAKG